jgi:hypothetical protein
MLYEKNLDSIVSAVSFNEFLIGGEIVAGPDYIGGGALKVVCG